MRCWKANEIGVETVVETTGADAVTRLFKLAAQRVDGSTADVPPWSSLLLCYLLDCVYDVVNSSIATAIFAWIQLAICSTASSTASSPPVFPVQRTWDNRHCEVQTDLLLDAAADHIERARC